MKTQILTIAIFLFCFSALMAQGEENISAKSQKVAASQVQQSADNSVAAKAPSSTGGINSVAAVTSYDFTVAGAAYVDGGIATPPMKEVEPNVFAMWNGDTNDDGSITNADKALVNSTKVFAGYHKSDLNFDASVTNADKANVNLNKPTTPVTHVP